MTGSVNAVMGPEETWQHPSPRLIAMRRAEVIGASAVVAAIVVAGSAAAALGGADWAVAAGAVALVAVVVAGLAAERFAERRVRAWAYRERDDDLLVQRGVLIRRLSVVPYGRMQFIDVVAGPIERFFGLATVRMHTAAAASDARIPGLSQDEADRLRDHLAQLGEARATGL